jgi:16S rRNA (cytosine967-C5)-methyltransferase
MIAAAREAAFRVLRIIASGRVDLGEALSQARDPLEDPRDRALATDLAIGTLRWQGALDYQLQQRSHKPLAKLDAAVLDALRLGSYQLLHLERVPANAIVNDCVELVKGAGVRSAAGFVNAILRKLARDRGALSWPDRGDTLTYLSVVHSHPRWLVQRWLDRFGADRTERWLRFNNTPPAMTLATNRLRGTRTELAARLQSDGVDTMPTPVAPHGLIVVAGRALRSSAFRDGYCLVQDEASQIVPELLQAGPGHRVLDACASPGGKTIAAAAQCAGGGLVIATDIRRKRVALLAATVARCAAVNVRIALVDPGGPFPFHHELFDRVLVDAPCSGLGTVRRDPDIRWRRDPAEFGPFARVQLDLLHRVGPLVASGGSIVYSTCSSEPEENEEVVAAFLENAAEFHAVPIDTLDVPAPIAQLRTADGSLRTSPEFGLEAFFAAVLQKR